MSVPKLQEAILRKPEHLARLISLMETNPLYKEVQEVAELAKLCLSSSATNDYLEKIGAEAIGARHSSDKLGADGDLNGQGVEVKPFKKSPGCKAVAVINDDTPMKLLKSHTHEKWLVLLCANKTGTQIHYALCAPFQYWEPIRYQAIIRRLNLTEETGWKWPTLPTDPSERLECLTDLVPKHQPQTYVRSSPITLDILSCIPKEEVSLWVHPELPTVKLHPLLKRFME